MAERLSEAQIAERIKSLPDWSNVGDELQRTFQFEDFAQAMTFVKGVAEAAESAQHHPDILIRYNKVTLTVSTHDAGGITELDFDLAAKADTLSVA